jgi:hypothetical protein
MAMRVAKWRKFRRWQKVRARQATERAEVITAAGDSVMSGNWLIEAWKEDLGRWGEGYQLTDREFHDDGFVESWL